jgi:hypothetical protein
MNVFYLLKKIYLVRWIKDFFLSALIASLFAIFFGFFHETWFVKEAFFAFLIPNTIFFTRRAILDRKAVQPFDDVVSLFDPKASKSKRRRGFEVLQTSLKEEADLEESDYKGEEAAIEEVDEVEEEEHVPDISVSKKLAETILKILIKHGNVKNTPELIHRVRQYFKDNEVKNYGLDVDDFIYQFLVVKSFSWGRYAMEENGVKGFYAAIFNNISSDTFRVTLDDLVEDAEKNQIIQNVTVNENKEVWRFTQYFDEPAHSFAIHLALLLNAKANTCLHWSCSDEDQEAMLIPIPLADELQDKTDFTLEALI